TRGRDDPLAAVGRRHLDRVHGRSPGRLALIVFSRALSIVGETIWAPFGIDGRREAARQPPPVSCNKPCSLRFRRLALDRGLAVADRGLAVADLDPVRQLGLRLLDVDFELAVVVASRDLILGHALRQTDRPREASVPALETVQPVGRDFLRALALGADGQDTVIELDRDRVLRDAGQIERVDDLVVRLPDIHRWSPHTRWRGAGSRAEKGQETGHLTL